MEVARVFQDIFNIIVICRALYCVHRLSFPTTGQQHLPTLGFSAATLWQLLLIPRSIQLETAYICDLLNLAHAKCTLFMHDIHMLLLRAVPAEEWARHAVMRIRALTRVTIDWEKHTCADRGCIQATEYTWNQTWDRTTVTPWLQHKRLASGTNFST